VASTPNTLAASSEPPAAPPWPEVDRLDGNLLVAISPVNTWYAAFKSIIDWCLAACILIPALPVILAFWCAIRATSKGPGFYVQKRLGRNGREFSIFKLRTMAHDAEASGAQWSSGKGDMRVTRLGALMRKFHIDELPQLFNVLMGQMSLVGPRPERQEIITKLKLDALVPGYRHRMIVKPGVTGLAQIQLPADSDINSVKHKIVYDLYYIENYTIWLDVRIMIATVMKAVMSPLWLRRVFFLPKRDAVAEVFHANLAPIHDTIPAPNLLTAEA
jgi:lipopolysaccharide/colanic/teichoic acid biosynthesis glycosyltransferase